MSVTEPFTIRMMKYSANGKPLGWEEKSFATASQLSEFYESNRKRNKQKRKNKNKKQQGEK